MPLSWLFLSWSSWLDAGTEDGAIVQSRISLPNLEVAMLILISKPKPSWINSTPDSKFQVTTCLHKTFRTSCAPWCTQLACLSYFHLHSCSTSFSSGYISSSWSSFMREQQSSMKSSPCTWLSGWSLQSCCMVYQLCLCCQTPIWCQLITYLLTMKSILLITMEVPGMWLKSESLEDHTVSSFCSSKQYWYSSSQVKTPSSGSSVNAVVAALVKIPEQSSL